MCFFFSLFSPNGPSNETSALYGFDFILLHFPETYRSRQLIRQPEDKLVSLSGILGLFIGINVVSIIEFLYLTCQAFWKKTKRNNNNRNNNVNLLQKGVVNTRIRWRLHVKETNGSRGENALTRPTKATNQYAQQSYLEARRVNVAA